MISVLQLGTIDYAGGLRLQQRLVELRKEGRIGDVLLLLEHTPVITLGRNAKASNLIASPELLIQRGVEVFETNRGGDVTFHGPGQIVGYPIFDLRGFPSNSDKRPTMGVIEYVRGLEEVLIRTCADFGIPTKRIPGLTGVWTNEGNAHVGTAAPGCPVEQSSTENNFSSRAEESRCPLLAASQAQEAKIAALGVHISRAVTSHGFALNVNADLSFFDLIIPCGIANRPVTSMQKELGKQLDLNSVAESLSRNMGRVFSSQMLWVESLDDLLGFKVGVPMQVPEELREIHRQTDDSSFA
ncbi:MAG: lipoyl(octanoyl) transferase LipB [Terriglobales bacterium]